MARVKPPCDSCGTRRRVTRHELGGGRYAYWCRKLACEAVARLKGGHLEDYMSHINDALRYTYGATIQKQLAEETPLLQTFTDPSSRRRALVALLGRHECLPHDQQAAQAAGQSASLPES